MSSASSYQLPLFDLKPVDKPAVVLNIRIAEQRRDAGIEEAIEHADNVITGWSDKAYQILRQFLNTIDSEFMVEQVRQYAAGIEGYEAPSHDRAWGGVVRRAQKAGLVIYVTTRRTSNVNAHRTPAGLWRKAYEAHEFVRLEWRGKTFRCIQLPQSKSGGIWQVAVGD